MLTSRRRVRKHDPRWRTPWLESNPYPSLNLAWRITDTVTSVEKPRCCSRGGVQG
jgi:hypothetical protein